MPFSELFHWKGTMLTLLRAADSCDDVCIISLQPDGEVNCFAQLLAETTLRKRVAVAGG